MYIYKSFCINYLDNIKYNSVTKSHRINFIAFKKKQPYFVSKRKKSLEITSSKL